MDDFERDELVLSRRDRRDKEQRSVAAVDNLSVWVLAMCTLDTAEARRTLRVLSTSANRTPHSFPYTPLYSRKLHIRVRRASTSCVTSFTILAFVLLGSVWNHFARRTLPEMS